jgi:hypothetical protein
LGAAAFTKSGIPTSRTTIPTAARPYLVRRREGRMSGRRARAPEDRRLGDPPSRIGHLKFADKIDDPPVDADDKILGRPGNEER